MADALPFYAELHCCSNFSFLRGASHPEELVERAQALGYGALAITDEASLAGVVRAHKAASACGLKLIPAPRRRSGGGGVLVKETGVKAGRIFFAVLCLRKKPRQGGV